MLHRVLFLSEDLKDCFALCVAPPTDEHQWEITVRKDYDLKYRDVFEHWLNNIHIGTVLRQESVHIVIEGAPGMMGVAIETGPLVVASLSALELDCWNATSDDIPYCVVFESAHIS